MKTCYFATKTHTVISSLQIILAVAYFTGIYALTTSPSCADVKNAYSPTCCDVLDQEGTAASCPTGCVPPPPPMPSVMDAPRLYQAFKPQRSATGFLNLYEEYPEIFNVSKYVNMTTGAPLPGALNYDLSRFNGQDMLWGPNGAASHHFSDQNFSNPDPTASGTASYYNSLGYNFNPSRPTLYETATDFTNNFTRTTVGSFMREIVYKSWDSFYYSEIFPSQAGQTYPVLPDGTIGPQPVFNSPEWLIEVGLDIVGWNFEYSFWEFPVEHCDEGREYIRQASENHWFPEMRKFVPHLYQDGFPMQIVCRDAAWAPSQTAVFAS